MGEICRMNLIYNQNLTHIFVDCSGPATSHLELSLQIAIFYEKQEFYWIGDTREFSDKFNFNYFGDKQRILYKYLKKNFIFPLIYV